MTKSLYGSKLEERRGAYLRAHGVTFQQQVRIPIIYHGIEVSNYTWDFVYLQDGRTVYEETKGFFHAESKIRFKLACAQIISARGSIPKLVTQLQNGTWHEKIIEIHENKKFKQLVNGKLEALKWNDTNLGAIKKKRFKRLYRTSKI